LAYFNIFGTFGETEKNNMKYHYLTIETKYLNLYKTQIGTNLHSEELDQTIKSYGDRRNSIHIYKEKIDRINGLTQIIFNCAIALKFPSIALFYNYSVENGEICRNKLQTLIELFSTHENAELISTELAILRQAANSSVVWDEIVNIEIYTPEQTEYVYDFTVPENQTFMTDAAVLIHNTLNTFHNSGTSSKSNVTRGVPRIEEILRLTKNPKNPSLTIHLKPLDELDQERAAKFSNMIEHTRLNDVVKSFKICFDPNDNYSLIEEDRTLMQRFYEFENMVKECMDQPENTAAPAKSKWIIRMEIDKEILLDKNITMDDIHFAIKNSGLGNEINCVYSDYNMDNLVFRIRMNSGIFNKKKTKGPEPLDQSDEIYLLKNFQDTILNNIVLRGVPHIEKVAPRKLQNMLVKEEGRYVKKDIWVLDTTGTNLLDVMGLEYIDFSRTYSNDIREVLDVLGIEAAREIIFNEITEVMEFSDVYINYHHTSILCDRMRSKEDMVAIFRSGILNDDIGPIAKATFEVHTEVLLNAGRHGEIDNMRGVSAGVMTGQYGHYGTNALNLLMDLSKLEDTEDIEEDEEIIIDLKQDDCKLKEKEEERIQKVEICKDSYSLW
jgi:DNA-directed RNA polymerase beta' subunit